jgi:hypothetical protein
MSRRVNLPGLCEVAFFEIGQHDRWPRFPATMLAVFQINGQLVVRIVRKKPAA